MRNKFSSNVQSGTSVKIVVLVQEKIKKKLCQIQKGMLLLYSIFNDSP